MKKTFLIFAALVFSMIVSSCSSEEDDQVLLFGNIAENSNNNQDTPDNNEIDDNNDDQDTPEDESDDEMNDDNNDVIVTESQLIGEWKMTAYEVNNGLSEVNIAGQSIATNYTQIGSGFDYSVSFSTNPNIATSIGNYTVTTTSETQGQSITQVSIIDSNDFPTLDSDWEITNGNQLKSSTSGTSATSTILEFTETTLVYSINLSQIDSPNILPGAENQFEGVDFSISGDVIITLTRVN